MTALPAWASELVCETCCPVCRHPVVIPLREVLQAQPMCGACGHRFTPSTPPGLPEIAALLATLEHAAAHDCALRTRVQGEW